MNIKRTRAPFLLVLGLAVGVAVGTDSHAASLWSQSPTGEENFDFTNFVIANDFELTQPSTLTDFTVWISDRAQSNVLDGVADNFSGTLGWALSDNAGGAPGSLLFSGSDTAPVVTSTNTLDAFDREVFQVDAVFSGVSQLAPGTYWLSIRDGFWGSASDGSIVGWTASVPPQLNPVAFETDLADPSTWTPLPDYDAALEIRGTAIPEPSSITLMGLGVLGLALGWNRRRRGS